MTHLQTPVGEAADESGSGAGRRSARLRIRAAWMYHVEGMTQNAIAEALGIGRVTVVRMLSDARALNEVKITLRRDLSELPRLESELERRFGLSEAIVAPLSSRNADPTPAVSAATGQFISGLVRPNMKLGVGWGRTLLGTLDFIDEQPMPELAVVSLLGGISTVRQYNPAEFAWRFSRLFRADCYLIAAPALVDSLETKRALVERCGIGPVFGMADSLDAVIVSAGAITQSGTSFMFDFLGEDDRLSLIDAGAVGDVLYNFFDREGRLVDHPINERVMGVGVARSAGRQFGSSPPVAPTRPTRWWAP